MKIQLIGDISGTRDGQSWPPRGTVIDLPDEEAVRLCEQRQARPVVDPVDMGGVEKAVVSEDDVEVRGPLTTKTGPGRRTRA